MNEGTHLLSPNKNDNGDNPVVELDDDDVVVDDDSENASNDDQSPLVDPPEPGSGMLF